MGFMMLFCFNTLKKLKKPKTVLHYQAARKTPFFQNCITQVYILIFRTLNNLIQKERYKMNHKDKYIPASIFGFLIDWYLQPSGVLPYVSLILKKLIAVSLLYLQTIFNNIWWVMPLLFIIKIFGKNIISELLMVSVLLAIKQYLKMSYILLKYFFIGVFFSFFLFNIYPRFMM